jgi:hypothetical protein
MPTLVGSVDIRALENAGINGYDVRECARRQFGSDLRIDTNLENNTLRFSVDGASLQRWRERDAAQEHDAVQVLTISGKHSAYSVALRLPLSQYTAQTKVVPTRSKKLLLI